MAEGSMNLGKATLDLTADLTEFDRNMKAGRGEANQMQDSLDALAAVSKFAEEAIKRVKMAPGQGTESRGVEETIKGSLGNVSRAAIEASDRLDKVKLTSAQAAETRAAADVESESIKKVGRQAEETTAKLEVMHLAAAGGGAGGAPGGGIGLMPGLIGAGTLLAPAAGPGVLGLLASIPVLAASGAGALGTLALAFQGVGKAIGGDKKAFDDLGPSAQQFTLTVRSLDGWFDKLKQTAGASIFPGLTAGLKAALSPGTLGAITTAVREFGLAIGEAGRQWGTYFGSTEFQQIFGPLMQAGARNLSTMSSAALSLFDAFGVLGRAAIPFTQWMTQGIAAGSRWADNFLHAKDATGALGGAMTEAEVSLRLVGNLFGSLLNAVYQLGTALYPVSKVAVKDLTDGFNALAGIIDRNKQTIRDLVGGALKAFVVGIETTGQAVESFYASMKQSLGSNGAKGLIVALGVALAVALGPTSVAVGGAIIAVGLIRENWGKIASFFKTLGQEILSAFEYVWVTLERSAIKAALAVVEPFSHLPGSLGGWARDAKDAMQTELGKLKPPNMDWSNASFLAGTDAGTAWMKGFAQVQTQGGAMLRKGGQYVPPSSTPSGAGGSYMEQVLAQIGVPATAANVAFMNQWANREGVPQNIDPHNMLGTTLKVGNSHGTNGPGVQAYQSEAAGITATADMLSQSNFAAIRAMLATGNPQAHANDPAVQAAFLAWSGGGYSFPTGSTTAPASDPFSTPPPFSKNTGAPTAAQLAAQAKKRLSDKLQIPVTKDQTLAAHFKALAAAADTGPAITKNLDAEVAALKKENVDLAKSMQGKTDAQKAKIRKQIGANEDTITSIHASIAKALDMTKEAGTFKQFQARLAASSLKLATDTARSSILSGSYLTKQHQVILDDEKSQATLLAGEAAKLKSVLSTSTGKLASQVRSQLSTVTSKLTQINEQVLQGMAQMVQDAQSAFSTALTRLQSAADAQLQSQLAAKIAALGSQFFQGGGQTPAEAQLAAMQLEDTRAQVYATGDPRQIQEFELGLQATAERTKADADYAVAVKQATDDETARQQKLDDGLAKYSDQMLNTGTSTVNLGTLFDDAGVSVASLYVGGTSPFVALGNAAADLADAFLAYSSKLGGSNSKSSAAAAAAGSASSSSASTTTIAAEYARAVKAAGLPPLPGNIRYPGIPQLDTGGTVLQSGLAIVDRGETFSGVGSHRRNIGGGLEVHVHAGTVIGGNLGQVARELAPFIRGAIAAKG